MGFEPDAFASWMCHPWPPKLPTASTALRAESETGAKPAVPTDNGYRPISTWPGSQRASLAGRRQQDTLLVSSRPGRPAGQRDPVGPSSPPTNESHFTGNGRSVCSRQEDARQHAALVGDPATCVNQPGGFGRSGSERPLGFAHQLISPRLPCCEPSTGERPFTRSSRASGTAVIPCRSPCRPFLGRFLFVFTGLGA